MRDKKTDHVEKVFKKWLTHPAWNHPEFMPTAKILGLLETFARQTGMYFPFKTDEIKGFGQCLCLLDLGPWGFTRERRKGPYGREYRYQRKYTTPFTSDGNLPPAGEIEPGEKVCNGCGYEAPAHHPFCNKKEKEHPPYPEGHLDETGKVVFEGRIVPGSDKPFKDRLRRAFEFGYTRGLASGKCIDTLHRDAVREFEEEFLHDTKP